MFSPKNHDAAHEASGCYDVAKRMFEAFDIQETECALVAAGHLAQFVDTDDEQYRKTVINKFISQRDRILEILNSSQSYDHRAFSLIVQLELTYVQELVEFGVSEVFYTNEHWAMRSKQLRSIDKNASASIEARCLSKLTRAELLLHLGDVKKSKEKYAELPDMVPFLDQAVADKVCFRMGVLFESYELAVPSSSSRERADSVLSNSSGSARERSSTLSSGGRHSFLSYYGTPERRVSGTLSSPKNNNNGK